MKKCIFVYRYYPGDNNKGRPLYYSKEMALKSFIDSYSSVGCYKKLLFVVDGVSIPDSINSLINGIADEIIFFGGLGNSNSYVKILDLVCGLDGFNYFYFSEDDYLYKKKSLAEFVNAIESIKYSDYISLYDHPDRYSRTDNKTPLGGEKIFVAGGQHWRTVESTCMTFGGRIALLQNDIKIHKDFCKSKNPQDRNIWHKKQGIGKYIWKFPKRHLIAPIPSLATHLEKAFLAPLIDWELEAQRIESVLPGEWSGVHEPVTKNDN